MKTRLFLTASLVGIACGGAPVSKTTPTTPTSVVNGIVVIPRTASVDPTSAIRQAKELTRDGLAQPELPIWWNALPLDAPIDTVLDGTTPTGSRSTGSVGDGNLTNSVELEAEGTHHEIVERYRKRKTNYGTKQLIDVIKHGAYVVGTEMGGTKLRVGNLSVQSGGDIRWSRSHNSGRDADLAFYVVDEKDESVPLPHFTSFDENGSSTRLGDLRFDVKRNWKLVEALVSHEIGVQWIFVSIPLKEKLLRHARENGVDAEIIARAEAVLHQPTDALPHDDHFHLRIACPVADRIEGCLPAGPTWPWLPDTTPLMLARTKTLLQEIENGDRAEEALEFMTTIRNPYRADVALWLLANGKRPELHDTAIAIARGPYQWSPFALSMLRALLNNPDSKFFDDALYIARRALDPKTWAGVLTMAHNKEFSPVVRAKYIDALIHQTDPMIASALVTLLTEGGPVATSSLRVLQHLTNHQGPAKGIWPKRSSDRQKVVQFWADFETNHGLDREVWLRDGFVAQGLKDADDLDSLVAHITSGPDFGSYNANRRLRDLTGRWSPLEFTNAPKVQDRWKKWIDRNRARLIAGTFGIPLIDGADYVAMIEANEDFVLRRTTTIEHFTLAVATVEAD